MPDFLSFLTADSGSVIGGVLLVVYAAITSLRKRRDLSIAELEKRVAALEEEIETVKTESAEAVKTANTRAENAETRAEGYQALMLSARKDLFVCRTTLADNGIEDPTAPAA